MAAPIVRVRVPQLARTGVRARLQPAEVVARSAGGVRARAGGCEIRAGAPRVARAPATLTLQLVQIGQNPIAEKKSFAARRATFGATFAFRTRPATFGKTFAKVVAGPMLQWIRRITDVYNGCVHLRNGDCLRAVTLRSLRNGD